MRSRMRIGGTALTTLAVAASACYGAVSDPEQPALVGERAALVQKKRDWLLNYDRHCGVCFGAFSLCEKGSADAPDAANCKAALDACVRGGLINDTDAGANAGDAGAPPEEDAAIGSDPDPVIAQADANVEEEDAALEPDTAQGTDEDAGDASAATCAATPSSPFNTADAGRRRGSVRDAAVDCVPQGPGAIADAGAIVDADADPNADAGLDDGEPTPDAADAAAPVRPGRPASAPNPLDESVSVCLEATQLCLDGSTSAQDCVDALQDCVRLALEQTFDEVCNVQVAACRAEGAPEQATRSVETLCSDDLPFN